MRLVKTRTDLADTYNNTPDLQSDLLSSAFPRRLSLRSFLCYIILRHERINN